MIPTTLDCQTAQANEMVPKKTDESSRDRPIMSCDSGKTHLVDLHITRTAINRGLYFRELKPLAVISGAGIASLAASLELRAKGFRVVIVEKRREFSRTNIINLKIETQVFLRKFGILKKFERIAARIKEHRYAVIERTKSMRPLAVSDMSEVQLNPSVSLEPNHCDRLFNEGGVYSIPINRLQSFLAKHALRAGVNLFGGTTVEILSRTQTGGVSCLQVTVDRIVQPDLFFIAEGSHSTTALQLGMKTRTVTNACNGEHWIFGNLTYSGHETCVISLIDTSEKALRLANVIFNSKSHTINVAVTSDQEARGNRIRDEILQTASQVFDQTVFPIKQMSRSLLTTVRKPVTVVNRTLFPFSIDNVFAIGEAAGSFSPLAGLGGTLALTLVPSTVRRLLENYETQSKHMNREFNESSQAYTDRWNQKSGGIKGYCLTIFDEEHNRRVAK